MARGFAIYRLPHRSECTCIAGEAEILRSLADLQGRRGYVIAPFAVSAASPLILIAPEAVETFPSVEAIPEGIFAEAEQASGAAGACDAGREEYGIDFKHFHEKLVDGEMSKIVLSRCSIEARHCGIYAMLSEACRRYPRMMVALFHTEESGTWIMATPEVLIERSGSLWRTMALAGTKKLTGDGLQFDEPIGHRQTIMWDEKNIQEQRYVATYISERLRHLATDITEVGPRSVRAGNLVHLRSDFTFALPDESLGAVIEALHPTPAVCGLPKAAALDFILAHEHADRKYYSGFTGPLCIDGATHLYVSLRCMQIFPDLCMLYAGGGLLSDSTEQAEWDETEAKMMIMRSLCTPTKKM